MTKKRFENQGGDDGSQNETEGSSEISYVLPPLTAIEQELINALRNHGPTYEQSTIGVVRRLEQNGMLQKAIEILEEVLAEGRISAKYYTYLSQLLKKAGRHEEAAEAARKRIVLIKDAED